MTRFLARRALGAVGTLVGVLVAVFLLLSAAPGDPARLAAGGMPGRRPASAEALEAFRAVHGLDRPVVARLAAWLGSAVRLDLGRSFRDGRKVTERIGETLPATLAVNGTALLLAALGGVPLGVAAARRPGGRADRLAGLLLDALFSLPSFALGLLLLFLFAVRLRWTPVFADASSPLASLALPSLTLALVALAPIARVVRESVRAALASPPAIAGRARGESPREETLRALRRSVPAFAGLLAALVPQLVAGSVLVERVFAVPGTGQLLADSVFARDLPTVLGLTLASGAAVVLATLLADALAALADPRLVDAEDS
ncbi:MAG TPA: ABC transporter permease [Thermoanaerobaculia bacterium]|nr:ABC transporter permease [Thermoanaerobaculia bacterium]